VRGAFRAQTTYAITVDGAICQSTGAGTTTVATGAYPPAVEFLSKGLYFSKIEPYLRFRHRAVSAIVWTIYRIGKENRYLFSRTEGLKVHTLQTTGESERMRKALPYLSYLEDYPGQRFTTSSQVPKADDWQMDALDLSPYYQEGDWLVVVASLPTADQGGSTASRGLDEADQDAEETDGESTASGQASTPLANIVLQFTNLGLYVRENDTGIWGQTVALDTGIPVFAAVLFKQKNGEVLHRADTDLQGWFRLSEPMTSQVKPQLHRIEAMRGEDSVEIFLPKEGAIPLREFPVAGADHHLPMQAFVYSDRGLYRLGETVHLTTLLRQWDLAVPQDDLASELIIEGPLGRVNRITLAGAAFHNGASSWSWSIPHDAKTGRYRAEVHRQGTVIGVGTFAVEQIIPPTLEAEVHLHEPYATWDPEQSRLSAVTGRVAARFLFGTPRGGQEVGLSLYPGSWPIQTPTVRGLCLPRCPPSVTATDLLSAGRTQTGRRRQRYIGLRAGRKPVP
jgi:MG2 domain